MLSLGNRACDGRKRFVMMEDNDDLEEGEAFSVVDPDIALSYIDEKLQDVLGHFQKDFEGGVSAENLGAKFGGYGSFLPAYQRSPSIMSQPKSPLPRLPNNPSSENGASASVSRNNIGTTALVVNNNSAKKAVSGGLCGAPQIDLSNKTVNSQKSLKVRIKVGPDNSLARNNAAIYSGLGLDVSPSSSPEESPSGSAELTPEFRDMRGDSPVTILQIMTCFAVPGGYLLSPLREGLMQISEKDNLLVKNHKTGTLHKGVPPETSIADYVASPVRDISGHREKKKRPSEKNGRSVGEDSSNCKGDTAKMLMREIDRETPASQKLASNTSNMLLLSSAKGADAKAGQIAGDIAKSTSGVSVNFKEPNKTSVKGRNSSCDLRTDDQFDSIQSMKSIGAGNSGNGTHLKGKPKPKTSLGDKPLEVKTTSSLKDTSFDMPRAGKSKGRKKHDAAKLNSVGNDRLAGHAEPMRQMSGQKAISHEKDGNNIFQGNDQVYEGKRKEKRKQNDFPPSVDLNKGIPEVPPPMLPKQKKKSSHTKGDQSENKSKMLRPHKDVSRGRSIESHRGLGGNVTADRVENGADLDPLTFTEKSKERQGVKRDEHIQISEPLANATFTVPASDAVAAPLLIKENWVCCDRCQKWRLLPYGTDPDHLPKKWKCSMQLWLPGLNSCNISEEETTKAFNDLYLAPAPEVAANMNGHNDLAASSITSSGALHFDQRLEQNTQSVFTNGKKKHGLLDASNVPDHSVSKKNLQASVKSRSLNDVNEYPPETNSVIKAGLGFSNKSTDFSTEKRNHKQKEKHKILGRHSDGGDLIGKSGKHSKSKTKREVDQDGRASKKFKKEGLDYRQSDLDLVGRATPNMDNDLSTKIAGKIPQNYSDYPSPKDSKCKEKGNFSASIKKSIDPLHVYSNEECKQHFGASDVEKSGTLDFSSKKRKIKEWQESQGHQGDVMSTQHISTNKLADKETFCESEPRKQKKARVSRFDVKEPIVTNVDSKMDKKGPCTRILLPSTREHPPDGMDEVKVAAGKEQIGRYQENTISRLALDDMANAQLPTAATSSSSKVSTSRRSKANFQESRGSPVESVSSSPLRISNIEKISIRRNPGDKDDVINVRASFMGSPKRFSDGEFDGAGDRSGTRRKKIASSAQLRPLENHKASESAVLGSLRKTCDYQDKGSNQLAGGEAKDGLFLKTGAQDDLSPNEFDEANVVGDTGNISDQHNQYHNARAEKDNVHDRDKVNNRHRANGSSQRKPSESSSLGFRERNRSSISDDDRVNLKASDSLTSQKELFSTKNGSNYRSEADFSYHDNSIYQDLRDRNYNFHGKNVNDYMGKKDCAVKRPHIERKDNRSDNDVEANLEAQHKDFNSRVTSAEATCCKPNLQENQQHVTSHPRENYMKHCLSDDRIDRPDIVSARGTSESLLPSKDKHEAQSWTPQTVPAPIKGSRSELYPTDAISVDAPKMVKQSRKPDIQNGVHPIILRQSTPNGQDASSPMRRDGPSVANVVLKEARDLKHTANRLKNEGLEHESIGLYFEAALKFLHGASLLEPFSAESAKHAELNPSVQMMKMYSDTAKLCEYCAHEYEKCKEMAPAALAYKCVEVAYLKVAYYKNPGANKDRHELQTALQSVLPGESPSSSASDVDNVNQVVLDKAATTKAVGSPQIAGNHVIAARNRPSFMRLLSYTNDVNCAFEATKRSQTAIAAAASNVEKDRAVGISSVRKVLDFNFHNVEGLLRLVRLAMKSISC